MTKTKQKKKSHQKKKNQKNKYSPNVDKSGFNFFDQIYVINLEKCKDRKKHIKEEFDKYGLIENKNYTFFKATDKTSDRVREMMASDFIFKYPPCFNCRQYECACTNNILIEHKIGNWCSFIDIFNDIKEKGYTRVLIFEDDIKFYKNVGELVKIFCNKTFVDKRIDLEKEPVIIRLEESRIKPRLTDPEYQLMGSYLKDIIFPESGPDIQQVIDVMSNAGFFCNGLFAKSFLTNLKKIETTSDRFIHCNLVSIDKTIRHFNMIPAMVYQLTDPASVRMSKDFIEMDPSERKMFYSEIHPKGIDDFDKERLRNHKMKA